MPQPNFVPVMPRMSRSTQSNGMSSGASTETLLPLTVRLTIAYSSLFREPEIARDCVPMIFSRHGASVDRELVIHLRRTLACLLTRPASMPRPGSGYRPNW